MNNLNEIDESQYKADFMISEGYIKFSSELLRLSLLAMGGFGALVLIRFKGEGSRQFLSEPKFFLISMMFFALCSAASLFHRYYASDTMSWYIGWLRAERKNDNAKATKERQGLHRLLRRSEISLILSECLFGGGVLFFIIAIFDLFSKMK